MSISDLLTQQLQGGAIRQIAGQIGADEGSTGKALSAALPLLMGAMAANAGSQDGATSLAGALDRDHDGSILDNIGGLLSGAAQSPGNGILKHLLGNKRSAVEQQVSAVSGLNLQSVSQLLMIVAPMVMGVVGKTKRQQGLDVGGLASMLAGERQAISDQAGGAAGNMLSSLLDKDGDGDVMDEVGGMLGGLFGAKKKG